MTRKELRKNTIIIDSGNYTARPCRLTRAVSTVLRGFLKVLLIGSLIILYTAFAAWCTEPPGFNSGPEFGQKFIRGEETLKLHVPQSFEGRTATEWRKIHGVELFNFGRFTRTDGRVELRGRATVFDFDYQKDSLEVELFRSKHTRAGFNACMDCHGSVESPRTTFILGRESMSIVPKPIRRGRVTAFISDADVQSTHAILNHWLSGKLMLSTDYRAGTVVQRYHRLNAHAVGLALSGSMGRRFAWESKFTISQLQTYKKKRTFFGNLSYRFGKRLKISLGGAVFLDGYAQFGTEMSEMGIISTTLEKDDSEMLPSFFQRLKDDRFGYLKTSFVYEYDF